MSKEKKMKLSASEQALVDSVVAEVEKKFSLMQQLALELEREKIFAMNLDKRLQKLENGRL